MKETIPMPLLTREWKALEAVRDGKVSSISRNGVTRMIGAGIVSVFKLRELGFIAEKVKPGASDFMLTAKGHKQLAAQYRPPDSELLS